MFLHMPKQSINPDSLFPSAQHGFSQIVVATGARTVFVSGQTAWDVNKQIVGGKDLAGQTRQALRNVRSAIEAAGGTLADVGALRIYIVDYQRQDAESISGPLKEFFPANPPVSTWIGVSCLAVPEFLVEIEATAILE